MGYVFLLILGTAAFVLILVAATGARRRAVGRTAPHRDMTQKKPAADEPTPAASSIATSQEAEAARKRTPPA
jgi:hypothetical protein